MNFRPTLNEFARNLPQWYEAMTRNMYYSGYIKLLERLTAKAERCGYLDMEDLGAIAEWGDQVNQHGIKKKLENFNTPDEVRQTTKKTLRYIHQPNQAISTIMELTWWGLTYGSKTLTFMNPIDHAMLDEHARYALCRLLPPIHDNQGHRQSMIDDYVAFLEICSCLQSLVPDPGPVQPRWRLADIGQALFEFGQRGGVIEDG